MVKKITKFEIIACYLNDYGKKYYLRELAFLLRKPHQTIKPYLEELVKEGVLIKNERKGITEYSLNLISNVVYDYLVISEKEKLMKRLKEDVLLVVLFEKLSVFFGKNTFLIFGSAVDNSSKAADIDLLVIGRQDISKNIGDFEKVYNKKIHKIQIKNMKKLTLTLIKEIYKKHLIFNNTEQIIRFFDGLYGQNKLV